MHILNHTSQDLLKYIHHFACNYYSDRAQLFHESRTWRKERKERRAREAAEAKVVAEDANSDDEEGPEVDAPSETVTPQRRDMYKTMDGSALLAIGTLFSMVSYYLLMSHKACCFKNILLES
jgi:hypothetical protein